MVEKSAVEEVIAEPLEVGLSVSEEIDDSLDSTFELVLMFDSTLEIDSLSEPEDGTSSAILSGSVLLVPETVKVLVKPPDDKVVTISL